MISLRMVLAYALLLQPVAAMADNLQADVGSMEEVLTVSTREREIRTVLGVLLEQGTATLRRAGESFLPADPQPGLQFNIDPEADEIYVGWRFQF